MGADEDKSGQGPDEVYDGAGNKIDVKKDLMLDAKTLKKKIKELEKKLKDGKKKKTLTDEEMWEIQDQLTELGDIWQPSDSLVLDRRTVFISGLVSTLSGAALLQYH